MLNIVQNRKIKLKFHKPSELNEVSEERHTILESLPVLGI